MKRILIKIGLLMFLTICFLFNYKFISLNDNFKVRFNTNHYSINEQSFEFQFNKEAGLVTGINGVIETYENLSSIKVNYYKKPFANNKYVIILESKNKLYEFTEEEQDFKKIQLLLSLATKEIKQIKIIPIWLYFGLGVIIIILPRKLFIKKKVSTQ